MLTTLRISGFAVVDAVEVQLGTGLNVLTGETGAGKSILVNALHLVLGGRMTADVLREGAEEASVEALFELPADHPAWARLGLDPQAGRELIVSGSWRAGGGGGPSPTATLCTVSMLEAALRGVVDISGQHEHVSLLDPAVHLELLDTSPPAPSPRASGGAAREGASRGGHTLLGRYREAHAALAALVREREELAADEGERARRADYLAFQLRELEAADPKPGELAALDAERRVLSSAGRLRDAARLAEALAYGEEGSASERAGQAARALADAVALDPHLGGPLGLLRSAAVELEEAGRELARYAEAVGGDPDRLVVVEDRLELLRALARKHGGSLEAALARRCAMRDELARLPEEGSGWPSSPGRSRLAAPRRSGWRRGSPRAGPGGAEAGGGGGAGARRARHGTLPAGGGAPSSGGWHRGRRRGGSASCGAERAEILIAPNPGELPRPLARIASGGELSRLLLATKRVLARRDPVSTYVFDEVDAGIGGAVAEAMGRVLADVSRGRQVVCVTHLPQVAAFADRHLGVRKAVSGGRTHTTVTLLQGEEDRRREVARMMAGLTVTARRWSTPPS